MKKDKFIPWQDCYNTTSKSWPTIYRKMLDAFKTASKDNYKEARRLFREWIKEGKNA